MPNPAILNALANPAKLELPDPMDQYGKMLQMQNYLEQGDVARQKREGVNRMRDVAKKVVRSDGSLDPNAYRFGLAQAGAGEHILDSDKSFAEIDKIKADTKKVGIEGRKTKSEILDAFLKRSREFLAGVDADNPKIGIPQYINRLRDAYNQPDYLEYLAEIGKKPQDAFEEDLSALNEAVGSGKYSDLIRKLQMGVEKATQQRAMMVSEEGKQTLVGVPEHGGAPRNLATYGPEPKRGTTVNVNTGDKGPTELEKKVGQGLGDNFLKVMESAQLAPQRIAEIDRAIGIVDKGTAFLGAGSQTMLDVVRAAKALGMKVNDEALVDTEQLGRFFAQNSLGTVAQFEQMGVRLTPMSDSDRALMERASVQGTNDPATIKRLLLIQRKIQQDSILKYNELAKRYLGNSATGKGMANMSVGTMSPVADRPASASIPPAAIDYLRKNPGLARAFEEKYGLPPGSAAQYIGGR